MEEITSLQEENQKLKGELKQAQIRADALQRIITSGKIPMEDNPLVSRLKAEIGDLQEKLKDAEKLTARIRELEGQLALLTQGRNWEKAVDQNILRSHRMSAYALCYAVQDLKVRDITQKLYEEHGIDVTDRTVYRSLSVKEASDYKRLTSLYTEFPTIFEENGISVEEIENWYTTMRTKKIGSG